MMVVNKISYLIVTLSAALISSATFANTEVIGMLERTVADATVQFSEKTEQCERQRKARLLPIDSESLSKLNLAPKDAVLAIGYLGMRNVYLCDQEDRMRLSYALSSLDAAKRSYQINDDTIKGIQETLVFTGTRYLELSVDYAKLPSDARKYLEQVAGTDPFDSIKAINSIR